MDRSGKKILGKRELGKGGTITSLPKGVWTKGSSVLG